MAEEDLVSIETEGDVTLFFDFVPIGLGKIKGLDVRVVVQAVSGGRTEPERRTP